MKKSTGMPGFGRIQKYVISAKEGCNKFQQRKHKKVCADYLKDLCA